MKASKAYGITIDLENNNIESIINEIHEGFEHNVVDIVATGF